MQCMLCILYLIFIFIVPRYDLSIYKNARCYSENKIPLYRRLCLRGAQPFKKIVRLATMEQTSDQMCFNRDYPIILQVVYHVLLHNIYFFVRQQRQQSVI